MPRSLWNGTISVGLINVPVKLYSAVDSKTVRFREVHIADDAKVEHRRFCSAENREVPSKAVVKGFEVGEDEYVVLSKDEIAAAAGDRAHVVEVELFVESGAIDPVFYEKTYYLGAGKDGADALPRPPRRRHRAQAEGQADLRAEAREGTLARARPDGRARAQPRRGDRRRQRQAGARQGAEVTSAGTT